jgi:hypothetical protein
MKLMGRIGVNVVCASCAPLLVNVYGRFVSMSSAVRLGYWTKRCMPLIGTGVCVIGQKPI